MNTFTRLVFVALLGVGFASQAAYAQDLPGTAISSLAPVDITVRFVASPLKAGALPAPMKLLTETPAPLVSMPPVLIPARILP
jgi:hypothetical protein